MGFQKHGIAAVPHGFRSSFRDWAAEEDGSSATGRGGGAGTHGPQPGRGGLSPVGPVRAQARPDGRLGCVSRGRASGPGGPARRLIRRARGAGGRVRQALKSGGAKAGS